MAHKKHKGKAKEQPPRRVVVALMSDCHCGHQLGLMAPGTELIDDDGNPWTPQLTKVQEYLWELSQKHKAEVVALAGDDEILVIHNGDACQGTRYPSRWVSERESDQVKIAAQALKPWLELPNVHTMRILAGTSAHNFGRASAEVALAELLQAMDASRAALGRKTSIKALYHGLFTIAGVTFDIAHHGAYPGSRVWLMGNGPRFYLRSLMEEELLNGRTPPRIVARGHHHVWRRETVRIELDDRTVESDIINTPSYTGLTDYAHQAARSPAWVTNGMAAIECVGGQVVGIHRLTATLDVRTREEL